MAWHHTRDIARRGRTSAGLAALLIALTVAGCGGGGGGAGSPAPSGSGSATLGVAGGAVDAADGVRVEVPADALTSDTTIRIAQDGTGAPQLPEGLQMAGSFHALTPHGLTFERPVSVRIPLPAVALADNQALRLAKTDAQGQWTVLADSRTDGDSLVAEVDGFSYFIPVVVTYPITLVNTAPLQVLQIELSCGAQGCEAPIGPIDYTLTITTNGGQVPSNCEAPQLQSFVSNQSYHYGKDEIHDSVPLQGGVIAGVVRPPSSLGESRYFGAVLRCGTSSWNWRYQKMGPSHRVHWAKPYGYPAIHLVRAPIAADAVVGMPASVDALFSGGASYGPDGTLRAPTAANRAVVEWQRSDDGGASWRTIAQSFEDEADPRPLGSSPDWRVWRVRHGFVATDSDAGALLRAHACYIPPDVVPPPCVTGPAARINLIQQSALPAFSESPRPLLVRTGQTASFTAAAAGTPAPTLQWQTRAANSQGAWSDVSGATGTTYTTGVLGLADNGLQVRVVAANAVGQAESAGVTVSVSDLDVAPAITTQPATIAVAAGGDAVFAVAARGTEALSYQWRFNGNPITGANASVLKLAAVTGARAGRYSVVVSNAAGTVTSDEATLDVTAGTPAAQPPSIVTQPVSVLVNAGNTATLAVGVAGTGPFSYQWMKAGVPVAGATAAYYSVAAATLADDGSYAVRVSNAAGSVTSWNVIVTVNESAAPQPVAITTQPSPQVQLPGGSATFAVAATGTGPLGYQWMKNGTPIAGANAAVLVLGNLQAADAASYSVSVTNALGGSTSSAASLTVVGAPTITSPPAATNVDEGKEASFAVAAAGQGLRYQWLLNGVGIPGADQSSYTTPPATPADSGAVYSVIVYNGAGLVFSQGATLTVAAAPVDAPDGKIAAGLNHTCAVRDNGTVNCWGNGANGELGYGTAEYSATPVRASGLSAVKSVAAGGWSSCAIDAADALWCWGSLFDALSPTQVSAAGETVASVGVGLTHACYARTDGTVWCWGTNADGQLGDGSQNSAGNPVQVRHADSSPFTGAVVVVAGARTSCAQRTDGSAWCWGADVLGNARVAPQRVLRRLPDQSTMAFTVTGRIVAGLHHTCGIESGAGQPMCWGLNPEGPLGDGTTQSRDDAMPVGLFGALRLAAGASHTCAIRAADMLCWGTAFMGNGGARQTLLAVDGTNRVGAYTNSPDPVAAGAAGERHTCVLRASGDVQCWGWGSAGQMGDGDTLDKLSPVSTTVGALFWRP